MSSSTGVVMAVRRHALALEAVARAERIYADACAESRREYKLKHGRITMETRAKLKRTHADLMRARTNRDIWANAMRFPWERTNTQEAPQ